MIVGYHKRWRMYVSCLFYYFKGLVLVDRICKHWNQMCLDPLLFTLSIKHFFQVSDHYLVCCTGEPLAAAHVQSSSFPSCIRQLRTQRHSHMLYNNEDLMSPERKIKVRERPGYRFIIKNKSDPSKPAVCDQIKSGQILVLGVLGGKGDEDTTSPHRRMSQAFSLTPQTLRW